MPEKLPVVAAIPNYNMGQQLVALLPELTSQGYADVFQTSTIKKYNNSK